MPEKNPAVCFQESGKHHGKPSFSVQRVDGEGGRQGRIVWNEKWKEYVFYCERGTIFNADCLRSIEQEMRK